jgi:hypothetical protein
LKNQFDPSLNLGLNQKSQAKSFGFKNRRQGHETTRNCRQLFRTLIVGYCFILFSYTWADSTVINLELSSVHSANNNKLFLLGMQLLEKYNENFNVSSLKHQKFSLYFSGSCIDPTNERQSGEPIEQQRYPLPRKII